MLPAHGTRRRFLRLVAQQLQIRVRCGSKSQKWSLLTGVIPPSFGTEAGCRHLSCDNYSTPYPSGASGQYRCDVTYGADDGVGCYSTQHHFYLCDDGSKFSTCGGVWGIYTQCNDFGDLDKEGSLPLLSAPLCVLSTSNQAPPFSTPFRCSSADAVEYIPPHPAPQVLTRWARPPEPNCILSGGYLQGAPYSHWLSYAPSIHVCWWWPIGNASVEGRHRIDAADDIITRASDLIKFCVPSEGPANDVCPAVLHVPHTGIFRILCVPTAASPAM
jgi:hypothetical protein